MKSLGKQCFFDFLLFVAVVECFGSIFPASLKLGCEIFDISFSVCTWNCLIHICEAGSTPFELRPMKNKYRYYFDTVLGLATVRAIDVLNC